MSEHISENVDTDVISKDVNKMIYNDQPALLDGILNYYPTLVDYVDINGRTWMHHAAESGTWGCMEILFKHGLDVNTPDVSGETPLHRAATRHHLEASDWLLSKGADPNAKNRSGGTPTLYAAEWSADALERMVLSGGDTKVVDYAQYGIEHWSNRESFLNRVHVHREGEAPAPSSGLKL